MTCKIQFPKTLNRDEIILYKVNAVNITSSWKELTKRAEITLPRNVKDFDKLRVREIFKHGDPIEISLGYDGENELLFTGYITQVSADIPISIKCEDAMWKLKQIKVNYSNKDVTLDGLLKAICPGYKINALEGVKLGSVRFAKTTVAKVLEKLQSDFNLYSWMKDGVLTCGKYYATGIGKDAVNYNLERNVVDNNLVYKNKEDIVLKITGKSMLKNGDKLEAEIGEDGGDTMELTYYNVSPKAELEKKIKADYEKAHRDGFEGSLTGYGLPKPQVGEKAILKSNLYPDRAGTYYIDGINSEFNDSGFRKEVQLGGVALPTDKNN